MSAVLPGVFFVKRRIFVGSIAATLGSTVLGPTPFGASRLHAQTAPAPAPAAVPATPPRPFGFDDVVAMAVGLAQADYQKPTSTLTAPFADLGYDSYRGIRFRREADPFGAVRGWGLDLLPPGMLYSEPVRINMVDNGVVRPLPFDPGVFTFDAISFPPDPAQLPPGDMSWSGFRLRAPLNRPDVLDELAVWQGASYFRVLGRGNHYGISCRGLALGTGSAAGEEFPSFREFWIEQPDLDAGSVTIWALLDSPSVAGAYQFVVTPGENTRVRTRVALVPRRALEDVGIAPLTSMYWFGPSDGDVPDDYRPAVHDSDGLQMMTGDGSRLWRALNNPPTLQLSAFMDEDPQGFGLMQRDREFANYEDAGAFYERRPSAWISPHTNWGEGAVMLVEIPVESEFHDNIVSFWKPAQPLAPGTRVEFGYDAHLGSTPGDVGPYALVRETLSGRSINNADARTFNIDFDDALFTPGTLPQASVTASAGRIVYPYVTHLLDQGLMRLSFEFFPQGAELVELQARLESEAGPLSETWMYRWVRE